MRRVVAGADRNVWRAISSVGRVTLMVGVVAWIIGRQLGWEEFLLLAGGCFVAVGVGLAFTAGRARLAVETFVEPQRVVVGEEAVGRVWVRNTGSRRVLPVALEAPVGTGFARFEMPSLAPGASWEDVFVIPTVRRSVMNIGPVSAVRGDPLGMARRPSTLADAIELYVHPKIVRPPGMTAGWIRDLEGRPTNDLSNSDVAFHTLREYVPGDDRRHIHWRTSARTNTLMVRQFVDSRRSHLGLVLSTNPVDYADDDEFELAVSVIGSLGVSALVDDQAVTVTTGGRPLPAYAPTPLLDALSGVEAVARNSDIHVLVKRSMRLVQGACVVALVTGSVVSPTTLRAASRRFPHGVRVLAIRVRPGADVVLQTVGDVSVLELGALDDLARVLRATVSR